MKYFSTFSGIGGFELGIKQAYESNNEHAHKCKKSKQEECSQGRERTVDKHRIQLHNRNRTAPLCVGYSEIDKYAIQVYNKQFNHKNYGDITRIRTKDLPNFDLLVGGFPCQAFSIAGKRKGFDDTRGTLFFDLARILADKRPRNFVFENVKGLLSHEQGKTFQTILGVLSDLGYRVEWQVLNSKNFGVPQNRERVFIVGHLGKGSGQKVFPIGEDDKISSESNEARKTQSQTSIASTIRTKEGTRSDDNFIVQLNNPTHSNDRIYSEKGISPTLNTMQGGRRQPFINKETKIRRLTPIECERLQGFPDNWTAEGTEFIPSGFGRPYQWKRIKISDTQRYKMCGNAVTVNVVENVISRLL